MATKEKFVIIGTALKALGIGRKGDKVSVEKNRDALGRVFVNGEYIGIFDFSRRTFVD